MSRVLLLLLVPSLALGAEPPAQAPALGAPYFESGPGAEAWRLFRKQDWAGAAAAFAALPTAKKPASKSKASEAHPQQARFLEAYARSKAGQFAEAAQLFDGLAGTYPLLADYHRLYAARAYLFAGKLDLALTRARAVEKTSPLDGEARFARAEALRQLDRLEEAEREYAGYLDAYPASWREPEVRFRLASVIEARAAADKTDRAAEARAIYRQIAVRFPTESWARLAEPKMGTAPLTGPEQVTRGLALFEQMRNPESEAAFRAALAAPDLAASQQCVAAYHLAQSVFKARERPRAAPLFDDAEARCAKAPKDDATAADLHAKALYQGARCHAAKEEYPDALRRFQRIEAEHPGHSYADDARLRQAEILDSIVDRLGGKAVALALGAARPGAPPVLAVGSPGALPQAEPVQPILAWLTAQPKPLTDEAQLRARVAELTSAKERLLASIPERYPAGDQGGESLFRLGFDAFRRAALDDARRWLETELQKYPREEGWWEAGRALYWLARVAEAQGKRDEAKTLWTRAAREYPLSYYALMALNRLREVAPDEEKRLAEALRSPAATQQELTWAFPPSPVFGSAAFQRGVELARLGLGAEARRELSAAGIRVPERKGAKPEGETAEALLWVAAVAYDRAGEWSISHSIPRYVLVDHARRWPAGDNTKRWRLSFPRGYAELIVEHARKNGQPVALQFAIVREESAFNPTDESFANAIGLTQLTMAPAKRFAQGLPYSREALRDPVINVTIGARELGDVWKKASGLAPLAIASYNAGEGAVRRWLRAASKNQALDEWIELIPFDETRGYTKRVLGSFFAYRWLYDDDAGDPVPLLPQSLLPSI